MGTNKAREEIFHFKQFDVRNSDSAMKVGTDSVLLGAWAEMPRGACRVLDVGCGSGVISLMLAQRNREARIIGIDIVAAAITEARQNAENSQFSEQLCFVSGNFSDFSDGLFDLIVSNPPFFTEALQSPDAERATARHEASLPLNLLLRKSASLLTPEGSLALILPAEADSRLTFEATLAGLLPVRHCTVITKPGKPARRSLWQLAKCHRGACENSTLNLRNDDNTYSEAYKALVEDFYIKL